jgi:DNA-binding NarL/FixJ family response regulator
MKVLLVDDNRLMLEGLQNLLEAHGIEVAGLAVNGRAIHRPGAQAQARRHFDGYPHARLRWPCGHPRDQGANARCQDYHPDHFQARTATCSRRSSPALRLPAQEHGHGGADRSPGSGPAGNPALFSRAGRQASGRVCAWWRSSEGTRFASESAETAEPASGGMLNSRQIEVLKMVADGLSYKEVGAKLHLSPRTVKYHMAEIMNRLHLENRAQVWPMPGRWAGRLQKTQ